jgi:hypothetical protein
LTRWTGGHLTSIAYTPLSPPPSTPSTTRLFSSSPSKAPHLQSSASPPIHILTLPISRHFIVLISYRTTHIQQCHNHLPALHLHAINKSVLDLDSTNHHMANHRYRIAARALACFVTVWALPRSSTVARVRDSSCTIIYICSSAHLR